MLLSTTTALFETNPEICNVTLVTKRVKGKGSVFNMTLKTFVTLQKIKVYVKMTLDDSSQLNGNKEFVNTVFDLQKVIDGIYSNPIARLFSSSRLTSN